MSQFKNNPEKTELQLPSFKSVNAAIPNDDRICIHVDEYYFEHIHLPTKDQWYTLHVCRLARHYFTNARKMLRSFVS